MENLCIASALPGTVFCSVLEIMEKTMISERLLPWFICSSFSLQFYASIVKERSLYLKLFVQSKSGDSGITADNGKSGDSGITADNGTDNYDRTKHPDAENNYLPQEERMHDGEEWYEDEDEDEDDDNGEQGSSDSGDDDQDDDDDSSDCNEDTCDENGDSEEEEDDCDDTISEEGNDDESSKMNTAEGVSKLIGKRNRAETSRGEESEACDGQCESHGGLVELLRRVEALEALELQLTLKSDAFNRHYNDFRPKFKDRLDVFLKRRDAIYTYAEIINGELRRMDHTPTPPTFEISMPDMNLGCIGDVPPHTRTSPLPPPQPPQVQRQGEGEALQETNDANTITRGGLMIEDQLARVQVLGLRMIESLQLVQENAHWLDNVQSMMDAYDKWMNSTSSLFSTKSNDLKRRGYNIPLWEDVFAMPSTSEIPNAVKEYASRPTSPPNPANNPPSSS